jgi:hypothetical protein
MNETFTSLVVSLISVAIVGMLVTRKGTPNVIKQLSDLFAGAITSLLGVKKAS